MSALLKAKSVIAIKRKERVQYPVHDSLKRVRNPPNLAASQAQPQGSSVGQTANMSQSQNQAAANTPGASQELLRVGDAVK